ncbi:MAG: hypothetical protein D6755_11040, partial [Anaerolineae bacterium]
QHARRFTHTYLTPWRKNAMWLGGCLLGLVGLALLGSLYLNVTSRAATLGREIQRMQMQIETTQRINADLTVQVATLMSAENLARRARDLGLQPVAATEIQYVVVPGYQGRQSVQLASPPAVQPPPLAATAPAFSESLIDWVGQQFSALGWPQALGALPSP